MATEVNPHRSLLDENAIIQRAFDEDKDRLRVDSEITLIADDVILKLDPVNDTVSIANKAGTNFLAVNPDGSINVDVTGSVVVGDINLVEVGGSPITLGQKTEANSLPVVLPSDQIVPVSGTVTANQGTSPWVTSVSGDVTVVQPTGTNLHTVVDSGTIAVSSIGGTVTIAGTVTANAGTGTFLVDGSAHTQPVSGTITANAGTGNFTVVQPSGANLHVDVDNFPATQPISGIVTVSNLPTIVDTNYGTVGANTIRTASQIGNATGAADFNSGTTSAQTLRTSANQGIPNSLANAWPVEITDGTDILGTSTHPIRNDPTGTTTQPISGTVAVTQSTSPWVVSGTVTANAGTGNFTVVQPTGAALHVDVDNFPATQPISGTVNVSNLPTTVDTSYGTVGASTIRTASQIGNATGAADFNSGATGAQTLRTTSNQGAPNSIGNSWPIEITDGTDILGTPTHPVRIDPTGTTTQPVSGTVTANIGTTGGLALNTTVAALQVAQGSTTAGEQGTLILGAVTTTAPVYTTAQSSPLSLTTAGALRTDSSGSTQPISGTVTANQGTSPWIDNITQFGSNAVVTGTGNSGLGIPRVTVSNDSSITNISGTISLPTNASQETGGHLASIDANQTNKTQFTKITDGTDTALVTAAGELNVLATAQPGVDIGDVTVNNGTGASAVNIQDGGNSITVDGTVAVSSVAGTVAVTQSTSPWVTKDQADGPVTPGTVASFSQLAGGQFNTALPVLTNTQQSSIQLDSSGRLIISPLATTSVTVTNLPTTVDTNYGTVGASTLRSAAQIGNATGAADFNAGTTGAQTLRVTSNITRNGTELSYNDGTSDANTLRVSANLNRQGNALDYNFGTVGANTLRTAAEIGNATGAADFNFGTVGAQTVRTAAEVGNATGAADFNAGTTSAQTLRTSSNITRNGTELSYNIGAPDANTIRTAAMLANTTGQIDYNYGTVGAQTIRTASEIGNATGAANFNAGATGAQTLRVASNIYDSAGNGLTSTTDGSKIRLDVSTAAPLTASSPTAASIGVASAQAVASNANRKGLALTNTSNKTISFGLGVAAVLNSGITLLPGGVWEMDEFTFTTAAINAIAGGAASNLAIQEFTF